MHPLSLKPLFQQSDDFGLIVDCRLSETSTTGLGLSLRIGQCTAERSQAMLAQLQLGEGRLKLLLPLAPTTNDLLLKPTVLLDLPPDHSRQRSGVTGSLLNFHDDCKFEGETGIPAQG